MLIFDLISGFSFQDNTLPLFLVSITPYWMDDVIKKAISKRKTVNSILIRKGFVDIGDKKTYEKLNIKYRKRDKI